MVYITTYFFNFDSACQIGRFKGGLSPWASAMALCLYQMNQTSMVFWLLYGGVASVNLVSAVREIRKGLAANQFPRLSRWPLLAILDDL